MIENESPLPTGNVLPQILCLGLGGHTGTCTAGCETYLPLNFVNGVTLTKGVHILPPKLGLALGLVVPAVPAGGALGVVLIGGILNDIPATPPPP